MTIREFDVVTIGEALLRLTPPNLQLHEQSSVLERFIGGSELNTAVGLARLGLRVNWLSRLTNNTIGHLIEREARLHGVYTDDIVWTDEDRIGLYYMEEARAPRASQVIYDRANSSASQIQPSDLPHSFFETTRTNVLHLTGITLAIGDSAYATAKTLLDWAVEQGITVSFDLNYRAKLWQPEQAVRLCEDFMQQASVIFIPERDVIALYGTDSIQVFQSKYPQATIIMTRSHLGSQAMTPDGQIFEQAIFPADIVCRIGGGDAFAAGYLYGYCSEQSVQDCLRWGSATASLKYSLKGDLPLVTRQQVETLLINTMPSNVNR